MCRQERSRQRVRSHLLAQLACLGRHTVTGMLCTGGRPFADWSADYRLYARNRVEPGVLFDVVLQDVQRHLSSHQPMVVAMDDSILRKRGRKIPGTAWRVDPLGAPFDVSFTWAQRVIQISVALPVDASGAARTLPIDFVQAPTLQRPRKQAPEAEWQEYRKLRNEQNINRQALLRVNRLVDVCSRQAADHPLWLSVDGRFTNSTMLKNLPSGQVLIGRIRGDAKLYEIQTPSTTSPPYPLPPTPCFLPLPQGLMAPTASLTRFRLQPGEHPSSHVMRLRLHSSINFGTNFGRRASSIITLSQASRPSTPCS